MVTIEPKFMRVFRTSAALDGHRVGELAHGDGFRDADFANHRSGRPLERVLGLGGHRPAQLTARDVPAGGPLRSERTCSSPRSLRRSRSSRPLRSPLRGSPRPGSRDAGRPASLRAGRAAASDPESGRFRSRRTVPRRRFRPCRGFSGCSLARSRGALHRRRRVRDRPCRLLASALLGQLALARLGLFLLFPAAPFLHRTGLVVGAQPLVQDPPMSPGPPARGGSWPLPARGGPRPWDRPDRRQGGT